jgi:peptide deformylase
LKQLESESMMPLEIAQLGQPILRKVAVEVRTDQIANPDFQQFLDAMLETLRKEKGAGLAAPQVFVGLRIFLGGIQIPKKEGEELGIEVFINPRITPIGDEIDSAWEGCLSFPELVVLVPRPAKVRIEYLNAEGTPCVKELDELPARIVQHEMDHLDGILTLDRAETTLDIVKASELEAVRAARGDDG